MPDNSSKFDPNNPHPPPEWINEKYFETILAKDVPNFACILNFRVIAAVPPGENYTSLLMRIHMDIELQDGFTQKKSYIMKTMLDNDNGGEMINKLNLFPKEKYMYESIIPHLEQLYAEVERPSVKFAPQCVWVEEKDGRITLVLEDLYTKKFKNVNRLNGFDMAHMKRVLEKLAEFHAATAVWQERNGDYPEDFQKYYLPTNYHKSKSYQARVHSYKTAMASWGLEDHEKYADLIPNGDEFVAATMQCFNTNPQDFKVLNHGDFWSSNIMINYAPTSVDINHLRFVDYQLCKWGSPAHDLWELIICSVESNLRIRQFDHFICIYHTHLRKCLQLLKYGGRLPKLRELHVSMLQYGFWGYYTTFTHLVLILLPADTEASLHKLMRADDEGDRFRAKAYSNALYVRAVLDIFPFFYRRGIFDFR